MFNTSPHMSPSKPLSDTEAENKLIGEQGAAHPLLQMSSIVINLEEQDLPPARGNADNLNPPLQNPLQPTRRLASRWQHLSQWTAYHSRLIGLSGCIIAIFVVLFMSLFALKSPINYHERQIGMFVVLFCACITLVLSAIGLRTIPEVVVEEELVEAETSI